MSHTYVELEVSADAYDEIAGKLREARYDHAFHDGVIDMHGIGLVRATPQELFDVHLPAHLFDRIRTAGTGIAIGDSILWLQG